MNLSFFLKIRIALLTIVDCMFFCIFDCIFFFGICISEMTKENRSQLNSFVTFSFHSSLRRSISFSICLPLISSLLLSFSSLMILLCISFFSSSTMEISSLYFWCIVRYWSSSSWASSSCILSSYENEKWGRKGIKCDEVRLN